MDLKRKKRIIPKALKRLVWHKYIGEKNGIGICQCCKSKEISQMDFQCGHIISEHNGGNETIDNLIPLCSLCNSSMGKKNMSEFMVECGLRPPNEVKLTGIHKQKMVLEFKKNKLPFAEHSSFAKCYLEPFTIIQLRQIGLLLLLNRETIDINDETNHLSLSLSKKKLIKIIIALNIDIESIFNVLISPIVESKKYLFIYDTTIRCTRCWLCPLSCDNRRYTHRAFCIHCTECTTPQYCFGDTIDDIDLSLLPKNSGYQIVRHINTHSSQS